MSKRKRTIRQRAHADHGRRVVVYGRADLPRGGRALVAINVGLRATAMRVTSGAMISAWLSRAELRKVRNAIDCILGEPRR